MLEVLIVIAVVIIFWSPLVMNTIGPFIIWRTQKIPTRVKFVPADEAAFMEERSGEFKNYDSELAALGFSTVGSSVLLDTHVNGHFRLYWHAELQIAAMVVSTVSAAEEFTYLEFTQLFQDGSVLSVNNAGRPEAYPRLAFKSAFQFSEVQSAEILLSYTQKIKRQIKPNSVPIDYDLVSGFGGVEKHMRRESDELLNLGFVNETIDEQGKRSLTLLGAFGMTFRSVSPGLRIFSYFNQRQARQMLESI